MKLIVTGSIAFDYLMSFPGKFSDHFLPGKLDSISVSFLVESLNKRRGGCAANIAYNLALLGEHPVLAGSVGSDFSEYNEHLRKAGVDTSMVRIIPDELTASFFANSDLDGNQIASFYTGAMRFAKDISLEDLKKEDVGMVLISPNDPEAMDKYVQECRDRGFPFIYDPGQQIIWLDGSALKKGTKGSKILILNDYELGLYQKKTNFSLEDILEITETLIVTKGDQGSIIHLKENSVQIPVAKVKQQMDPTGVGDAFRAGLMKGLLHGLSWEISGRMGSLTAAYVLETDGPQNHSFDLSEFIDRYNETFGESDALGRLLSKS